MATKKTDETKPAAKKPAATKAAAAKKTAAPKAEVKVEKVAERKVKSLSTLKTDVAAAASTPAKEAKTSAVVDPTQPKLDKFGRAYATGRRKTATARVWLSRGKGTITVNGKTLDEYFTRPTQRMVIRQPLVNTKRDSEFDIKITVVGSGPSGQAGAVRHGIARAMINFEPTLRGELKAEGFLTRDSREVERKKPGLRKARRRKQWKKR